MATRLATLFVCQSGLGDDNFLRWTTQPTPEQEKKIDELLRDARTSVRARLQARRPLLDHIAAALEQKQELSGNELRRLAESSGHAATTTA